MTQTSEQGRSDWHRRMTRPDMAWLPNWVKDEYLQYLSEITAIGPQDEATLDFGERTAFYERILCDKQCRGVWATLEAHRRIAQEFLADGSASPAALEINQVGDLLQAAHSIYRSYSELEAMTKKERDAFGDSIGITARKLSKLMSKLWLSSPDDERGYPIAFADIRHDTVQEVLSAIESAAAQWVTAERVVHKPGAGDARRRFFMCSMGNWFESVYREVDAVTGAVRAYRFDNVITALTNCLFTDSDDGGLDQPTVTRVLDAASTARAAK